MKAGKSKDWAGKYDPLGGHIEKGEEIISSANREIREESGLIPDNTELKGIVHVSNFYGKEIMMFITSSRVSTEEVKSNEEGDLKWVSVADLGKYPVLEDLKIIINKVSKLKTGEMLTGVSIFGNDGKLLSLKFNQHQDYSQRHI